MNNDFMVSAMKIKYSNTRRSKVNNMKRFMVLVSVCFLTLSFAKEQTAKVSLEIQKDIQKKQLWANEIDYHFIDCLILRLNLVNTNKNEGYAKITNSNIADLELNQFKNVKIVVSNPPFKRGANK